MASTLKVDDVEWLRLQLAACLLVMLIVAAGALFGIWYFDHRATRQKIAAAGARHRDEMAGYLSSSG